MERVEYQFENLYNKLYIQKTVSWKLKLTRRLSRSLNWLSRLRAPLSRSSSQISWRTGALLRSSSGVHTLVGWKTNWFKNRKIENRKNRHSRKFEFREICQDIVKNGESEKYDILSSRILSHELYFKVKMILVMQKVKNRRKSWHEQLLEKCRIESKMMSHLKFQKI